MGRPQDYDMVVIPRHDTAHFSMYSMTNPGLDIVDLYAVDGMKHSGASWVVHLARHDTGSGHRNKKVMLQLHAHKNRGSRVPCACMHTLIAATKHNAI